MYNARYDLTGKDNQFAQTDTVRVCTPRQPYELVAPAYLSSIEVYRIDGTGRKTKLNFVTDDSSEGWRYTSLDLTSMSKAKTLVPTGTSFTDQIVKSIQINLLADETDTNEYQVMVSYQRLTIDIPDYVQTLDAEGPAYSRKLGRYLLEKVEALDAAFAGIKAANVFGASSTITDFLDVDLTGIAPSNYVQYERHQISSSEGKIMIMPSRGSFYPSDLVVAIYKQREVTVSTGQKQILMGNLFVYADMVSGAEKQVVLSEENFGDYVGITGGIINITEVSGGPEYEVLTAGVDYEVADLNLAKTEKSFSTDGVYDAIRFIREGGIEGTVVISYRAFGGTVDVAAARAIRRDLSNVQEVIGKTSFLSSESLGKDPTVQEIRNRISKLEDFYGSFYQVEHQVTKGLSGFQWFNIAEIYDLDFRGRGFPRFEIGAVDEVGHFRVESKHRNWCYEFIINLDLTKTSPRDMLKVKTVGATNSQPLQFKDYMVLAKAENVAVRVLFTGDGHDSGVILQLGWDFDKYDEATAGDDTDSIIVTNKSGSTSKWRLYCDPQNFYYTDLDAHRVIDHVKLQGATSTGSDVPYYTLVNDYVYYATQDPYVIPDKYYFGMQYNQHAEVTYIKLNLSAGLDIKSLGPPIF